MTTAKFPGSCHSGVSLLELLIAVSILGIIISVAMPGMSELGSNQRLLGAAEQVFGHLQQARSEAITRNTEVYANFAVDGTTSWEYGVSSSNSMCNLSIVAPATATACVIVSEDGDALHDPGDGSIDTGDLVLMRFTSTDYEDVTMNIAGFSSGNTQFVFDPVRGMATSGQVNLSSASGRLLRVTVNLLGRVAICSPDGSVQNYGAC